MRAAAIDYRSRDAQQHQSDVSESPSASLMTPARRAGLEALEREFSEFLKRQPT
jgi:hypothetical protein